MVRRQRGQFGDARSVITASKRDLGQHFHSRRPVLVQSSAFGHHRRNIDPAVGRTAPQCHRFGQLLVCDVEPAGHSISLSMLDQIGEPPAVKLIRGQSQPILATGRDQALLGRTQRSSQIADVLLNQVHRARGNRGRPEELDDLVSINRIVVQ
jgi:hypothetical protein